MAGQLAEMIAQMKLQLGYGQYADGTQGEARSGWGLGTSPYAVSPAPADGANQVENREGNDSLGDTQPTNFEPLYAPEDYAHGFSSEDHLRGNFDPTQMPKKVEEVRSAPESQEALAEYVNIIGAYAEGDEAATNHEQVPLEYQELVKQYFDQLQKEAKEAESEKEGAGAGAAGQPEDSED